MPFVKRQLAPDQSKASVSANEAGAKKTPRAEPEEAVATTNAEYFSIITSATNDAVRDWKVKEGTIDWPAGLEKFFGYAASATTGGIAFWLEHIHPDDRDRIQESLHQTLAGAEEHWSSEYQFQRADGQYLHIYERALIVRCPDSRVISSMMDVSERKQLQTQFCRTQRMEAFGQLAGGVAHDFNNFLTTILGYSDLLLSEKLVQGQVASQLTELRDAAERASALTNQLLAFSRRQALEPSVLEINSLMLKMEQSLLRVLGEEIAIEYRLHQLKEGMHIKADAGQLTQLILNLAANARDAMKEGGSLTITTGVVRFGKGGQPGTLVAELTPGEYVTIDVADTGSGMSEEIRARIFEPFFTTKVDGPRSGLGLATSYGIVRQSGGNVEVESVPGEGSTFRIFLPRTAAPVARRREVAKLRTGSETILVLEDDLSVRHLSVRVLRKLGYEVLEAAQADDAKLLLAERGGRKIDLLLTDMIMPKMSGRTFATWLATASPHTKVIFVSGYLAGSMTPVDRCAPETRFLAKPFTAQQLATKVREALDDGKKG